MHDCRTTVTQRLAPDSTQYANANPIAINIQSKIQHNIGNPIGNSRGNYINKRFVHNDNYKYTRNEIM